MKRTQRCASRVSTGSRKKKRQCGISFWIKRNRLSHRAKVTIRKVTNFLNILLTYFFFHLFFKDFINSICNILPASSFSQNPRKTKILVRMSDMTDFFKNMLHFILIFSLILGKDSQRCLLSTAKF